MDLGGNFGEWPTMRLLDGDVHLRTLFRGKFVLVATVRDGGVQIDSSRIMIKHTFKKY